MKPCITSFEEPSARPSIPVHRRIRSTALEIAEGIQDGAREHGLDGAALDLQLALRAALDDLDGMGARWLAGEPLSQALKREISELTQGADGRWRPLDAAPA